LAAILAADIAGYSALMGADEEGTVRDLKGHQAVILPMISEYGGRIIDLAGDGILAEFGSVLAAVQCALTMQRTMNERNAPVGPARRMQFRIGVNQGDVVFDDARVYGDGVNIAARLENIAEPGGICISAKVHDEVTGRIEIAYEDLGLQQLKNIAQPVRAYRIETGRNGTGTARARPTLALPDKPSIAVLPFTNLNADPGQDYFSDGITEDIITELSRFSELFVIARNSSFQYKGKSPDIRQVGRELGVRYVLEGSIRRAGDRVRITAQLIDASNGVHRWAERYDRKVEDVFAVQDEVARTIVAILAAHVSKAEAQRTLLKAPAIWQAHDFFMRASATLDTFFSSMSKQDLYEARRLAEQSFTIDPTYARAYAILSFTYGAAWINPLDSDYHNPAALDRAHQLASKAVQLDPNLPQARVTLGTILAFKRHDASIMAFEQGISLNPNFSDWRFALALASAGEHERAAQYVQTYMRLDPFYPPVALHWLGAAWYMSKQYVQALTPLRECVSRTPNFRHARTLLAAAYAHLGQMEAAHAEVAEVLRIDPAHTIERARHFTLFRREEDVTNLCDGLHKAGLPEK
jgi:adenylate cyclase